MEVEFRIKLRRLLVAHFSEEELRTLCFDLDLEYDDLPALGRAGKVRELVVYLERGDRLAELVEVCVRLRPNVSWTETLSIARQTTVGPHAGPHERLPEGQIRVASREQCLRLVQQITGQVLSHADELAKYPGEDLTDRLTTLTARDRYLAQFVGQYRQLRCEDIASEISRVIQGRIQVENTRLLSLQAERNLHGIEAPLLMLQEIRDATTRIELLQLVMTLVAE